MAYDNNFQSTIFPTLIHAFEQYLGSIYSGRIYFTVASKTPTYPLCVYQSQDGGGKRDDYIGSNGWKGLITFRSLDLTQSGAWNKIYQLSQALSTVTASGYDITYTVEHPMSFPVEEKTIGSIYTAAIIVKFEITKSQ